MKILYFHQHFSTPQGSTAIRSYQMAKELIQCGHQVTVVCGSYGGAETGLLNPFVAGKRRARVEGIEIIELDIGCANHDSLVARSLAFMRYALRSLKLVFTESYDLLFSTSTPLTVAIPGIVARWFARKLFVFEVRDLWPELPKAMGVIRNPLLLRALSFLEWLAYRSAHRLIGLSPGIVEGIRRRGIAPQRVAMIPNGCDLALFAEATTTWRPQGLKEEDFLCIFAGAHGLANGLEAVLDAALELKTRGRMDIKFLLIGQGKMKPSLRARAAKEALDNLIFLDPVNKEQLAGLLKGANLGLQILANVPAFYYGTSPNKFFDYLAAGLPVLNNYPGWLAELIAQHDCGFVVPPENPRAFADALEQISANRAYLKAQGQKAQALAQASFDRDKLAREFVKWVTFQQ